MASLQSLQTLMEESGTIMNSSHARILSGLPPDCLPLFLPVPQSANYGSFVVSFQIKQLKTSSFVHFL